MKKKSGGCGCLVWLLILGGAAYFVIQSGALSTVAVPFSDTGNHAGSSFGDSGDGSGYAPTGVPAAPVTIQPISFERTPYYPLSGCAHSRLHVGDRAVVSYGGGVNGIRSYPDTHPSNNIVYRAPSGEGMQIVGGPTCNWDWILWEVKTDTGYTGWTPESGGNEFWLTPIDAGSDAVAQIRSDPQAREVYDKINSTLQDPYLTESQKKQQIRVYQRTYGEELVATVIRYVPVYQENGTFTSFDTWSKGFTSQTGGSSGSAPIDSDPVGSTMSIFFDPSSQNITQQLGLGSWSP